MNEHVQQVVHSIHPTATRAKNGSLKPKAFTVQTESKVEPVSVKLALAQPKWKQAMQDEYDALMKTHIWTPVPKNSQHKLIGNEWVFRIKRSPDG